MTKPEPFEWRGIKFYYLPHRDAWIGLFMVSGRDLNFCVKDLSGQRPPLSFQAWAEWYGGHTVSCTMPERADALEGALLELIDSAARHQALLEKFP